ncbi:MAG: hypothetical protein ACK57D_06200 [Sphingobacteriales bacterium]|jgi:hypothetical protein
MSIIFRKFADMAIIRISILLLLLSLGRMSSIAQPGKTTNLAQLKEKEDSLKAIAPNIVMAREAGDRFRADSHFTRLLVRALKVPHSFNYPFDSILNISRLYAPDSSFRIFTWQVVKDESMARRHGAIQMKTADGSLKLFPLIDKTLMVENQNDTITGPEAWIGAIYYKIVKTQHEGKNFYTFLGYDEHSMRSTKKRIEVMHFDTQGKPVFGGPYISFQEDSLRKPTQARFAIEYKKDGNARLQFDQDMDMIIFDHLIPENGEKNKLYTYIPDGDYEGFKWKSGKWVHVDKVFNFALKDGEVPLPSPLTEDKFGNKGGTTPAPKKKKGGN